MENNDLFGGVYYINLESRTDRKQEIEEELNKMGLKYNRFNAIQNDYGIIGCTQSHLEVLKDAKRNNLKNVLIFEDDFLFLISKERFFEQITSFFDQNNDYDVLMLSYNLNKSEDYNEQLYKVLDCQTASGYIVNNKFLDKLINLYEQNLPLLISTGMHWVYANDVVWKQLQPNSNWFALKERAGLQRPSYSNLTNSFVDYKC